MDLISLGSLTTKFKTNENFYSNNDYTLAQALSREKSIGVLLDVLQD